MSHYKLNNIQIAGLSTAVPANTVVKSKKAHRIAVDKQTTSDLGFEAASQVVEHTGVNVSEIGLLIFLSRTPDYRSPATAMVLQHRLGFELDTFAYDINSGGLSMFHGIQSAGSILESLNTNYALVIFGDTPSKQIENIESFPVDYTDAASALLLKKSKTQPPIFIELICDSSKFDTEINIGGGFRFYDRYVKDRSKMQKNDHLKLDFEVKNRFNEICQKRYLNPFLDKTAIKSNEAVHFISGFINSDLTITDLNPFKTQTKVDHPFGHTIANDISLKLAQQQPAGEGYIVADAVGEGLSYGMIMLRVDKDIVLETIETDNYFSDAEVSHNI